MRSPAHVEQFLAELPKENHETARERSVRLHPDQRPPVYDWPNGKRLAVVFANNIEHFAFKAGVGLNDSEVDAAPSHRNSAWRDYGNRIGMWRMFDVFDELDLPMAQNVNAEVMPRYPDIVAKVIERGDEFIAHGRTNSERSNNFWEDDEARYINEITEMITEHAGNVRRVGWALPLPSLRSRAIC